MNMKGFHFHCELFPLVQVYIPSMLIVILSFVSFWIDHKSVGLTIVGTATIYVCFLNA